MDMGGVRNLLTKLLPMSMSKQKTNYSLFIKKLPAPHLQSRWCSKRELCCVHEVRLTVCISPLLEEVERWVGVLYIYDCLMEFFSMGCFVGLFFQWISFFILSISNLFRRFLGKICVFSEFFEMGFLWNIYEGVFAFFFFFWCANA